MKQKKKNIAVGAFFRLLFPTSLWTRQFFWAWIGCFATVIAFDILWCAQTTFRAFGFIGTYVNAATMATLLAMPVVIIRRPWLQMLVLALVDVLMLANLMYCLTYFNSIPAASYLLAGQVLDFHSSITDSWRWVYITLPVIAIATLFFINPNRDEPKPRWIPYIVTLVVMCLFSTLTAVCAGGLTSHVAKLKGQCYYAATPVVIYTIPGTLVAELTAHDALPTNEERTAVAGWNRDHMALSAGMHSTIRELPDSLRRDNLVVIFCESLESWPVGAQLEGKELTPSLNKAMADTANTWYASHVLSQVGPGRSIDGQLLMLAGMYPTRDVVYSMKYPFNTFFALPAAMKQQGATTYLFSGDKPGTWNQALIARAFGIDNLDMADSWDNSQRIGHPARLSDCLVHRADHCENEARRCVGPQ